MSREERLKNDCNKLNVPYILPQPNATSSEDNQRINILRRRIADERGKRLCAAKIIHKLRGSSPNPPSHRSTSPPKYDTSFRPVAYQGLSLSILDHVMQASPRCAQAGTSQNVATDLPQRHFPWGAVPTTIFVPSCGTANTASASNDGESLDHAIQTPSQIQDNVKREQLLPATQSTRLKRNVKKRAVRYDDDDTDKEQPKSCLRGSIEIINYVVDPDDQASCKSSSNAMTLLELCTLNNGAGGPICLDKSDSSSAQSSWMPCVSTLPPKKRKCLPKSRERT
jgi:hypothetical protein